MSLAIARRIHNIETHAYHAWPAAEVEVLDGWRLRSTAGVTRRANSVWPNTPGGAISLEDKLARVEAFYADRGQLATYQICPAAQPADLDSILALRGYVVEAPTSVQTARTAAVIAATAPTSRFRLTVREQLSPEWFFAYCAAEQVADEEVDVRRGIFERVQPPRAHAMLTDGEQYVAAGYGVLAGGRLGIFGMATVATYRRQGAAAAVLHALAVWGFQHAAASIYLQVTHQNRLARSLYARAGFRTLYDYQYRVRQTVPLLCGTSGR